MSKDGIENIVKKVPTAKTRKPKVLPGWDIVVEKKTERKMSAKDTAKVETKPTTQLEQKAKNDVSVDTASKHVKPSEIEKIVREENLVASDFVSSNTFQGGTDFIPKMARPLTVYEKKHEDRWDYIVTNNEGVVVDNGSSPLAEYESFLSSKGYDLQHNRVRIDINPFIVRKEFLFEKDIQASKKLKLVTFIVTPLVLATIVLCFAFLKSEIKNTSGSINANIETVKTSVTTSMNEMDERLKAIEDKNKDIERDVRKLREGRTERNTAPSSSRRAIAREPKETDEPVVVRPQINQSSSVSPQILNKPASATNVEVQTHVAESNESLKNVKDGDYFDVYRNFYNKFERKLKGLVNN